MQSGVSVAEFAKVQGVSPTAVHKAIASGRLKNCLINDPSYKKPRIDPIMAAKEWERNTEHSKRHIGNDVRPIPYQSDKRSSPSPREVIDSYKARLLKVEYDKKMGILIDASRVKEEWFKVVTETKTKILSLPSKAKASMPNLTADDILILERLCREALEDLASGND
jgi:hypothetical protein